MPNRHYNFQLPYTISGTKLQWGLSTYKGTPAYQALPRSLRAALEQGEATGRDVQVRKADLDRLPDQTWEFIRRTLGLP